MYVAHASAGPFRLFTKSVRDLRVADHHRRLLLAIKQEVSANATGKKVPVEELTQVFARAVHEMSSRAGQNPQELGLSFAAAVPAKYWIGRELRTPRFPVERMAAGLEAFQSLRRARDQVYCGKTNRYSIYTYSSPLEMESAWVQLRQEYIRIWSEAGWGQKDGLCGADSRQNPLHKGDRLATYILQATVAPLSCLGHVGFTFTEPWQILQQTLRRAVSHCLNSIICPFLVHQRFSFVVCVRIRICMLHGVCLIII